MHPDDELSAGPWFGVDPGDGFPEKYRSLLGLFGPLRDALIAHYDDLFDPSTWQEFQHRLPQGEIIEIYPYDEAQRPDVRRPAGFARYLEETGRRRQGPARELDVLRMCLRSE